MAGRNFDSMGFRISMIPCVGHDCWSAELRQASVLSAKARTHQLPHRQISGTLLESYCLLYNGPSFLHAVGAETNAAIVHLCRIA